MSSDARDGDVLAALRAATSIGATNPDVVAVEARRIVEHRVRLEQQDEAGQTATPARRVVSLTERHLADPTSTIAALPADTRPLPTVNAYDELLAPPPRAATVSSPCRRSHQRDHR